MTDRAAPLSLLHLVNLRSANVGNGALTKGTEAVLAEDISSPLVWSREPWDDYSFSLTPFDGKFVEKVNASDAMIVGGAVTFNGRPYYPNAGMRFDLPAELWGEIRRPVVFYGLSYRHWPGEAYHHADKLKEAIKRIRDSELMLLALRNDGTREWLQDLLDLDCSAFDATPDPAVFVPAEPAGDYPEIDRARPNVMLALNDEDAPLRYRPAGARESILRAIAVAIEHVIETHDANVILAPHYFDDCRMIADFVNLCRPQLAHRAMTLSGLAGLDGTENFYGRYLRADLAISMRVHSMSPCIGLGVPMIPIVTQQRMKVFLNDIGLDDIMIDAFDPDLAERLGAAIDAALADPDALRKRQRAARDRMRERTRAFNRRVDKLLSGR